MALIKKVYTDGKTTITAENLNQIQDAVIENQKEIVALKQNGSGCNYIIKADLDMSLSGVEDAYFAGIPCWCLSNGILYPLIGYDPDSNTATFGQIQPDGSVYVITAEEGTWNYETK